MSIDASTSTCDCSSITSVCYYNNCTEGDIKFSQYTANNEGGTSTTRCKACICLDYDDYYDDNFNNHPGDVDTRTSTTEDPDTDDSFDNFEKCGFVESREFWDYLSDACEIDCEYDDAIFDDDTCGCPTCPTSRATTSDSPEETTPEETRPEDGTTTTQESREDGTTTTSEGGGPGRPTTTYDTIFETAVNTIRQESAC